MDADLRLLHGVVPATVTVAAEIPADHASAAILGTSRAGTGAVVDQDGNVLTVNYVVLGASRCTVTDLEGRRTAARVVAQDFATGVAVLATGLDAPSCFAPGSSQLLPPGHDCFLVASAGPTERRSASGFVVSDDSFDAYWEYFLPRALWTNVSNPGLGGAPLCDARGRLCGVASLNLGNIGRSTLAIPAEHYFDHAEELLREGRRTTRAPRAWIGLFCYALPDRTVVAGLIPGSPGERCGLETGDILVGVGDKPVTGRLSFYEDLWCRRPGDDIDLKVMRNGRLRPVTVTTGDAEAFFSA